MNRIDIADKHGIIAKDTTKLRVSAGGEFYAFECVCGFSDIVVSWPKTWECDRCGTEHRLCEPPPAPGQTEVYSDASEELVPDTYGVVTFGSGVVK